MVFGVFLMSIIVNFSNNLAKADARVWKRQSGNKQNRTRPTSKVPGRGPAAMGQPNIQSVDHTEMVVTEIEEDDFIAKSDKYQ